MLNRRNVCAGLSMAGLDRLGAAHAQTASLPFYASLGPRLVQYDLDVAGGMLRQKAAISLPANLQYAWPIAARRSHGRRGSRPTW